MILDRIPKNESYCEIWIFKMYKWKGTVAHKTMMPLYFPYLCGIIMK